MKLERRGTKILEKLISVPPRLLETLEYMYLDPGQSLLIISLIHQSLATVSFTTLVY